MKNNIEISVVILNYNGLKYLKRTLNTILNFNFANYEVIIVDNASTDGSIDYLEGFDSIRLVKNKVNFGYSKGKNIGVKEARGDWVLLLDEDILIEDKELLKKIFKIGQTKKDIMNLSLLLTDEGESETEYYGGFYSLYGILSRPRILTEKILDYEQELVEVASPDGGALFFRRLDFLHVGAYDESQPYFLDVGDYGIRSYIITGKKNYLYTKASLIHLGVARKIDIDSWCWKFKYILPGLVKIMLKNCNFFNAILRIVIIYIVLSLNAIRYLFTKRTFKVLYSYFVSVFFTVKSVPSIIRERKLIQSKRFVKKDLFLKIKPPKFY